MIDGKAPPAADWRAQLGEWIPKRWRGGPLVPVVRLSGVIGGGSPLRAGMTLASVAKPLDRAFGMRGAKAVAIVVNSPGGAPVQSRQIFLRIRQLADKKNLPVLIFVEDVAASGGYMIACAGEEIFCDPSSILGSIGVVGGTFGFVDLIRKIGVERRLYTAGTRKAQLDPFLPEDPADVAHIKELQRDIHATFIALVKERRGARLNGDEASLFSGDYWAGERSIALGLADGIGDVRGTLRARFGDDVRMPLVGAPAGLLATLLGRRGPGSALEILPQATIAAIEDRAMWSRFGL